MSFTSFGQTTQYISSFDYKNINTQTFIPAFGFNNEQKHLLTILKHSFELQQIISCPIDTLFYWNGLVGKKSIYTKDSLILIFLRPADTITRPCILLTHGNDAEYRSKWHEKTNFNAIDLAMRGYCVAYYENTSSRESTILRNGNNDSLSVVLQQSRNAFYHGFQSAVAAEIFIKHNASGFNLDTTKLFAGGYSFGAFCSLTLASADVGVNFIDSIFRIQGNYTAKSIYNDSYIKNIKSAFSIGGALPKDDTLPNLNSKMGNFLDENDTDLSLLFLHGRTDNLISFNLTKLYETDTTQGYYFAEGPSSLINSIRQKNISVETKLIVNCKGGHNFSTSVCGYSNPYCLAQWHWLHLEEPPDTLISGSPYFTNISTDSMLRYAAYMLVQTSDVDYMISDFFQPKILNTTSTFSNALYFLQPQDSFKFANTTGHYVIKNVDCEGNPYNVITAISNNSFIKNDVKVYPNPSNGFMIFEALQNIENISIYNILGAIVKDIKSNQLRQQIDVHDISNGEYVAVIQLKNKIVNMKISVVR